MPNSVLICCLIPNIWLVFYFEVELFDDIQGAVPQLRRLAAGFPPRRPGFETKSGHVVDKVVLGQVFS
jgi:hypothetical protein